MNQEKNIDNIIDIYNEIALDTINTLNELKNMNEEEIKNKLDEIINNN